MELICAFFYRLSAMSRRFRWCSHETCSWNILAANRDSVIRTRSVCNRRCWWKSCYFHQDQLFHSVHCTKCGLKSAVFFFTIDRTYYRIYFLRILTINLMTKIDCILFLFCFVPSVRELQWFIRIYSVWITFIDDCWFDFAGAEIKIGKYVG